MTANRVNKGERGFTLLEVLIALAILCTSLAVFYQSFSLTTRLDHDAERDALAAMFADSKMAGLGVSEHLEPGEENGTEEGGLSWTLESKLVSDPDDQALRRYLTYQVTLDVFFDKRKYLEVTSLRQAAP